jgi:hypothetical protein
MDSPSDGKKKQMSAAMQGVLCIGALLVLVWGMYYSYTYPYPSGKPPDLTGFLFFWLREIVILALAALFLLGVIAAWLVQLIRRIREQGDNAP